MQDSWFSSYDAMHAHMLRAVAEVNEALAAAQMSHIEAHHLHANGFKLMHGWASTLFNSSPDFWKAPHIEDECDCFQALGWYLQSVPHKALPHIGETIDVEVQELPTAEGAGPIIWKKGEVIQHLTATSFKARINNEFDFLQIYHLSQEDVEWRRIVFQQAAQDEPIASTPTSLSVAVLLDSVLCVKVLSFLRTSQPETLLCAGAVCRLWRQCFYFGRFVSYACGRYMIRAPTRWMLMRGEDCHGTEAGPTHQPVNSLCMPVHGLLSHTSKQVVGRSHARERRRKVDDEAGKSEPGDQSHADAIASPETGLGDFCQAVSKVLDHHVYGGAKSGSLFNIYVRLQYLDGSTSGKAYVPASVLEGTAMLKTYMQTNRGQAIQKYCTRAAK